MNLVQYIVVRADLKWPIGALIAQGCHASVSAIVKHMPTDNDTQLYVRRLDSMTKVVLRAESESQLLQLCDALQANHIEYVLWREQPDNTNTCLATVPRDRTALKHIFSHLKLFS